MPAKNSIKTYLEEAFYHLYNRGVEKRNIFLDDRDYKVFLNLLANYLQPVPVTKSKPKDKIKNLANEIDLLLYCLMPNHFHLLVKQHTKDGITKLIRRVCTTYTLYFNDRYSRIGTLFQGKYKAVMVQSDEKLIHLSRYIHLNPTEIPETDPFNYPYSSIRDYLSKTKSDWLKPEEILNSFESNRKTAPLSYESFIKDFQQDSTAKVEDLILED